MKQARSMTARSHRQWLKNNDQHDEPDVQSNVISSNVIPWTNQTINELSIEYAYETTATERKGRLASYGSMLERYNRAMKVKRVRHPQLYQPSADVQQSTLQQTRLQEDDHDPVDEASTTLEISISRPLTRPTSLTSNTAQQQSHAPTESHAFVINEPHSNFTQQQPHSDTRSQIESDIHPGHLSATKSSQHKRSQSAVSESAGHHRRTHSAAVVSSSITSKPLSTKPVQIDPVLDPNGPIPSATEATTRAHRLLLAMEDRLQLAHAISPPTSSAIHTLNPRLEYAHPHRNLHDSQSNHNRDLSSGDLKAAHDRNQRDRLSKLESMTSSLQESREAFSNTASAIIANQRKLIQKDKQRCLSNKRSKPVSKKCPSHTFDSNDPDYSSDDEQNSVSKLNYSDPFLIAEIIRKPSTALFSSTLQRSIEKSKKSPVADAIKSSNHQRPSGSEKSQPDRQPLKTKQVKAAPSVYRPQKPVSAVKQLSAITDTFLSQRSDKINELSSPEPWSSQYESNQPSHIHVTDVTYQPSSMTTTSFFKPSRASTIVEESKETIIEEEPPAWPQQSAQSRLAQIEARLQARWAQEQASKSKRSGARVRFSEDE